MEAAVLRKKLHACIDAMSERNLYALTPLMSVLAAPPYTIETDLSSEEIAMIDERMTEYHADPSSFVSLESVG